MSGSSSEIRKSLVLSHLASKGNEREDTLGGKPEVALGVCEDLLDGSGVDDGGNERVHAAVKKLAGIGVHAADDGDARDASTAAAGRDAGDHLAVGGLPVGVALARDAQAATGKRLVKADKVKHPVHAAHDLGIEEEARGGAKAAGVTRKAA